MENHTERSSRLKGTEALPRDGKKAEELCAVLSQFHSEGETKSGLLFRLSAGQMASLLHGIHGKGRISQRIFKPSLQC